MLLEAWLTLLVILIALVLFVTEAVTVDLAAFIVMSLLLVLGLVTPAEGISGFANPATITVLAMFVLSAGVERTGAVTLLAQKVARWAGNREFGMLAAVVLIVAPVSAFINNTAAVAIMIPLVVGITRDAGRSPGKILMPLSFASMLAGTVTLIGTSTNILASSISASLGYGAFGMFEFAVPGLLVALVGITYLLTVGRFLVPDRGGAETDRYEVHEYLGEVMVPEGSKVAGQRVVDLRLPQRYGVEIVTLTRGGEGREPTAATRLAAEDELLLLGTREKLLELASLEGLKFKSEPGAWQARGDESLVFYELMVAPQSRVVGKTLAQALFRARYGGTVVAVRKGGRVLHTHQPIATTPLDAGDALLVAGRAEDRDRVEDSHDFFLVEELGGRKYRREKMSVALAILAGVVGVAALGVYDILVTAIVGAALMALLGVLTMDELHRAIRWDILFLLAGVIPLGIALERSGLAGVVAGAVASLGGTLHPVVLLMVLFGLTTLLTEVMSNNASIVLLAPIAAAIGASLGLNPKLFILTVAFAASTSFLSPIGYQTNTLVYGPGAYRFTDYARVGLPLNLILVVVAPLALVWYFGL